jgi:hypothetical protein
LPVCERRCCSEQGILFSDWPPGGHGAVCGYDYLCVAKKGYDAPTGLGTPDGTGAF